MQNHPQLLLRRPLPPKLPKLPLYKQVRTATTDKIEPPQAKFTQGERDITSFPVTVSRKQLQPPVSIQNLSFDDHGRRGVTTISVPSTSPNLGCWHIPDTATGYIFFPSCPSASTRVFGKETKQMKRSRKTKREPSIIKEPSVDNRLKDILIFSSTFSKPTSAPSPVTPHPPEGVHLKALPLSKSRTYTFKHPLIDSSVTRPTPLLRITPVQAQKQLFGHLQQSTAVLLNITQFPGALSIPAPVLPRKPRRQSELETRIVEAENLDVQGSPAPHEGLVKLGKLTEAETQVKHREVYKTVVTTQYETINAMTNLALVNCQIYGRNALNLKGFFILNCPDLTSLALQLIYLNLSFNDISSFPTEIAPSSLILCITASYETRRWLNRMSFPFSKGPILSHGYLNTALAPFHISCMSRWSVALTAFQRYLRCAMQTTSVTVRILLHQVFCLKYLQILILRNNPITAIPSEIQQLRFLRVFNIAFNLIMSLPPGLFYLPYLEELNISYNSVAVIPNEIQKLRSLKQLVVDGNDLTSFPPGILKLNLKKIQFDNNFTHPYLWKENSLNSPQRLTQIASLFFLKNNLHKYYDVIPAKIQVLLKGASKCEWCEGPRFGEGYRVIQSCNVFGAARLPVLFHVCSSSCYQAVNENSVF